MFFTVLVLCCLLFHPALSAVGSDSGNDLVETVDYPVCVVGAGISGLGISTYLQRKGYKVEIFEKNNRVGGKMNTYRETDEIQVEMGPFFYSSDSKFLMEFINSFNLTNVPFNYSDMVAFDPNSGIFQKYPMPTTLEAYELGNALVSYISERAKVSQQLETGYLHATSELFQPTAVWMKKHNLEVLTHIFSVIVTVLGYGDLNDVPAIYTLQVTEPEYLVKICLGQSDAIYVLKEGYDVLARKMSESLNVHLNHTVTHINRELEHPVIFFEETTDNVTVKDSMNCSQVILAFPPIYSSMKKIMNLTSEEEDIFKQVKIHKYTTAANYIPNFENQGYYEGYKLGPNNTLQEITPEGKGEIICFMANSSPTKKGIYSSYHWIRGDFDELPTKADMENIDSQLEATLKKISKDAYTFHRYQTEYFPHVTNESLENGFYKKFDRINGQKNIYYATTLLKFETMDYALQMADYLVQRFF